MTLPFDDLERLYESLARHIDRVGADREALFLAKLVLLLAHEVGDGKVIERCVRSALADLPVPADGAAGPT